MTGTNQLAERLEQLPRSHEYREFLQVWGDAVGLRPVFIEQLDEMIAAEILAYVEPFVLELTAGFQAMLEGRDPVSLALARLLADLIAHLESCPEQARLADRCRRAQQTLGMNVPR